MRFKVGDKVRVREDLEVGFSYGEWAFNSSMTVFRGKELTVDKVYGECYQVKENHWYWTDEMLEEVKSEVKEKTFREVIADIKEGEIWVSSFRKIVKSNKNIIIEKIGGAESTDIVINLDKTYTLQRKEYSFEEAFKAYEEGKEIESCYSQYKFKKANGVDLYSRRENKWYEEDNFEIDEIRGKWYIND